MGTDTLMVYYVFTMLLGHTCTFPFNPHDNLKVGSSITPFHRQRRGTEKYLAHVMEMAKLGSLVPDGIHVLDHCTTKLNSSCIMNIVFQKINYSTI